MLTNFKDKNGKTIHIGDILYTEEKKAIGEVNYLEEIDTYFLEGINYIIPLEKIDTKKYYINKNFCLVKIETFLNNFSVESREFWNKNSLKIFLKGFKPLGLGEDNKIIFNKKDKEIVLEVTFNKNNLL